MLRKSSVLIFLVLLGTPARAEDESLASCAKIAGASPRLACFDRVAKNAGLDTAGNTIEPAPTVTTKEIVAPIAPADYKNVDPADLRVAPNKFMNKPIELRRAHCFYADANEYRCIATSGTSIVTVFAKSVLPEAGKTALENDCGTVKTIETRKCERTIHLIPIANETEQVNAFASRMVLLAPTIEIVALPRR